MSSIQRQGPDDLTFHIPAEFAGQVRKGQVVRVYGKDFGMVITPRATGGDATAVQLMGKLVGIPMLRDADGNPLISGPFPSDAPQVKLRDVIPGVLEVVDPTGPTTAQMLGRILGTNRSGTTFAWAPNIGTAAAAGDAVTHEELQAAQNATYAQVYQAIVGGAPEDRDTLIEISQEFDGLTEALASKQDHAAALDELSETDPTTLGKQLLEATDAAAARALIGASAEPIEGAYAEKDYVDAQDAATLATIRGGVDGDHDTLAKLLTAVNGRQVADPTLDTYAASEPTPFGISLVETDDADDARALLGAIGPIADGTYATPDDLDDVRGEFAAADAATLAAANAAAQAGDVATLATIRDGVAGGFDTLAKLATALAGKQAQSANLDALAASTSPTALGLGLLSAQDAAAARAAINAQVAGAYATADDVAAAANQVKADLLGGAGAAYDTLKELQDFLEDDQDAIAALTTGLAGKQPLSTFLTDYAAYGATLQPGQNVGRRIITYDPDGDLAADIGTEKFWSIGLTDEMWDALNGAGTSDGAFRMRIGAQAQSDKLDSLVEYLPNNPHPFGKAYAMFYRPEGWNGNADQLWSAASLTDDAISDIASGFSRFQLQSSVLDQVVQQVTQVQPGDSNFLFSYLPGNNAVSSLPFSTFGSSILGKGAAGEAGKVYYNSGLNGGALSITTTTTSRAIMARQPAAAGEVVYATDTVGGIAGITTGAQGRALMAIAGATNQTFYFNGAGTLSNANVGTFGLGLLSAGTPTAGSIPYATDGAGSRGFIVSTVAGRNLVSQANPATGSVNYFTDAAGTVGSFVTGIGGRNIAALGASGALQYGVPYFTDSVGSVGTITTTSLGRSMMTYPNTGVPGVIPITTNANTWTGLSTGPGAQAILTGMTNTVGAVPYISAAGVGGTINSTTLGRSFLGVASAQAARALTGRKAATFYTNASVALAANTPTEISFAAIETSLGFDQADVLLSGTRIQANSTSLVTLDASGAVVVDGACDLMVTFNLTTTAGVAYAPLAGNGISRPETAQVPASVLVKIPAAGRWIIPGPRYVPMTTTGGNAPAQLRVTIQTPAGAAAVNVTSLSIRLDQHALEAIT